MSGETLVKGYSLLNLNLMAIRAVRNTPTTLSFRTSGYVATCHYFIVESSTQLIFFLLELSLLSSSPHSTNLGCAVSKYFTNKYNFYKFYIACQYSFNTELHSLSAADVSDIPAAS